MVEHSPLKRITRLELHAWQRFWMVSKKSLVPVEGQPLCTMESSEVCFGLDVAFEYSTAGLVTSRILKASFSLF